MPEANYNMVRAGITMYGLWPSDEVSKETITLKPVMSLKSHVSFLKELEAGRSISYGGTYVTQEPRRIATVPVGYGDGYARSLSNKGYVLIHGQKAYICGRVCMDQFMVDVTDIPNVKEGDPVTLLGTDGDYSITMEELGALSGRFNYEFACLITPRVPRIY
jgi:alanine racemase